jgi:hypothetical protein
VKNPGINRLPANRIMTEASTACQGRQVITPYRFELDRS